MVIDLIESFDEEYTVRSSEGSLVISKNQDKN
ncbi:MAG: hypothetical protein Ct9H300mP6_17730 [Gammaproteobacteria bacterium]|nr:MAG: hypothetical protein Ct9H300mP6_17730 [Gammaproteobacteria bacterium]